MSQVTKAVQPGHACCVIQMPSASSCSKQYTGFRIDLPRDNSFKKQLNRGAEPDSDEDPGPYVEPDYNEDVFAKDWKPPKLNKNDPSYGRPKKGSLTERRGIAAGNHICKEIIQLCEIISQYGKLNHDSTTTITFGEIFAIYVYISDKVVGMLLRARKHGIVHFEGEMLFQRRDEAQPITLLRPLDEVRKMYAETNDPKSCVTQANGMSSRNT